MTQRIFRRKRVYRSIVKALTFRVFVIVVDVIILFWVTRRLDLSLIAGFVLFSNVARTFLYFFHERVWDRVQWGRAAE